MIPLKGHGNHVHTATTPNVAYSAMRKAYAQVAA
jgi:hypothetical protein